ncbi:MAG: hypothetical protein ACTSYD_13155 [Candidatus Heimdallarchaeaceae archaeon]
MTEQLKSETKMKEKTSSSVRKSLQLLNKEFLEQKWVLIISAIIAPFTFVTGLFVPFEPSYLHWLQTLFFIIASICLVIVFSFLFNKLWIALIKEEEEGLKEKSEINN